jgi:hypothetical protein
VEKVRLAYGLLQAGEAADVYQAEEHERHQPERDQEELQDLVVDRGGEAAQDHVPEHYPREKDDARRERPAEEQLEDYRHRVHVYAGEQDHEDGEQDGVEPARRLVVAELQEAGTEWTRLA